MRRDFDDSYRNCGNRLDYEWMGFVPAMGVVYHSSIWTARYICRQAIGIAMVVAFLAKGPISNQDDNKDPWLAIIVKASLYTILYPLLTVIIGYIVASFL